MIDWVKSRVLFFTAVPFSVVSMAVTQALVVRGNSTLYPKYPMINVSKTHTMLNFILIMFCLHLGTLSPSPRFGSLPKVVCKSIYYKLNLFVYECLFFSNKCIEDHHISIFCMTKIVTYCVLKLLMSVWHMI